jgi:flagellar hook-associated protein 1 FlgK
VGGLTVSGFGVAFNSAAHALSSIQQALNAVENNVVNASTPGYAAERVDFSAAGFDLAQGLSGGLEVTLSSTRDQYLEKAVRTETSALGLLEQQSPLLDTLQSAFSASGDDGIPGAFASFAGSFAVLSAAPNDVTARDNVIQAATRVAQAFNETAAQIFQLASDTAQQASAAVTSINQIAAHIAYLNSEIQKGAQHDTGIAANLNSSLETLSKLVDLGVSYATDGTASVLLGGQTPLVMGSLAYSISIRAKTRSAGATYPGGDAGIQLLDQNGADITGQASQGKLGALLEIRNQSTMYYLGNQTNPGVLNTLAKTFAGRVNTIVTAAQAAAGATVQPLYTYHLTDDTRIATTLAVTTISASQVVSTDGVSSNGAALELSSIDNSSNAADLISGLSFTAYYGEIAARAGSDASRASSDLTMQQDLTTQAQNQRSQASGVSLNVQAAQLLALQQAYQATARIITILDNISQTAVNLIPQA